MPKALNRDFALPRGAKVWCIYATVFFLLAEKFRGIVESANIEQVLDEATAFWRRVADSNDGAPRRRIFVEKLVYGDSVATIFRSVRDRLRVLGTGLANYVTYEAGYDLVQRMISKGDIRSLDDVPRVFALLGIGVVDIVRERLNRSYVRIYECLSCFGSKPIGKNMCFFELGALKAVFDFIYGKVRVVEKECWGYGNKFCGFEIVAL